MSAIDAEPAAVVVDQLRGIDPRKDQPEGVRTVAQKRTRNDQLLGRLPDRQSGRPRAAGLREPQTRGQRQGRQSSTPSRARWCFVREPEAGGRRRNPTQQIVAHEGGR